VGTWGQERPNERKKEGGRVKVTRGGNIHSKAGGENSSDRRDHVGCKIEQKEQQEEDRGVLGLSTQGGGKKEKKETSLPKTRG